MRLSLSQDDLKSYLLHQIENFFPDKKQLEIKPAAWDLALERLEHCFKHIVTKNYTVNGEANFYHLHSDQYATFLYFLANSTYQIEQANTPLSDKLILLNRTLNSVWISYKCQMPDIFLLVHPLGTILGNAQYSDYLVVMQNVTVNTGDGKPGEVTPKLGKYLFLAAGAKIVGDQNIGDNVSLGVNVCAYKKDIKSNTLLYRDEKGMLCSKENHKAFAKQYFK